MTADSLLLNLTKPVAPGALTKPATRTIGLERDPRRDFRAALTQESRHGSTPKSPRAGADAPDLTERAKAKSATGRTHRDSKPQSKSQADSPDSPNEGEAHAEHAHDPLDGAQDARLGKDARESSRSADAPHAERGPQAENAEEAGESPDADAARDAGGAEAAQAHEARGASVTVGKGKASSEAAAGEAGTDQEAPGAATLASAAHSLASGKPLTIRELNKALRSLDGDLAPEGLLSDLGLSGSSAQSDEAGASRGQSTPADHDAAPGPDSVGAPAAPGTPGAPVDGVKDERNSQSTSSVAQDAPHQAKDGLGAPTHANGADPAHAGPEIGAARAEASPVKGATDHPSPTAVPAALGPGPNLSSGVFKLAASTGAAHSGASTETEALQQQIARGLLAAASSREGGVTLRLNPEALGPLRIDVEMRGAEVQVRFAAATPEVLNRIREDLPTLRETLEKHGLSVGEVSSRLAAEPKADALHETRAPEHANRPSEQTDQGQQSGASFAQSHTPNERAPDRHGSMNGPSAQGAPRQEASPDVLSALMDDADLPGRVRSLDLVNLRVDALA